MAYSNSYYRELDHQSAVRLASRRAEARGEARGRKEEREKTQKEMVGRMHQNGMSVSQIANILGYSEDTVRNWLIL